MKSHTVFEPDRVINQTQEWLQETYVPTSPGISGLEWCNANPPAPKMPTLFLVTPPSTAEDDKDIICRHIVVRSPHDIMDGTGTLHLLNKLLEYAAQECHCHDSWIIPQLGTETASLSPPLRVAALAPILTLKQQEQLRRLIDDNESLHWNIEILTIPFKKGQVRPGRPQRVALEISTSDTTRHDS